MKNLLLFLSLGLLFFSACSSQSSEEEDKKIILSLMMQQQEAWNNYDLESFMETYWNSDSLKFYGASGLTYGYEQTLANYHKRYPSKEHTGTLNFTIKDMTKIEEAAYFVMGEYHLVRSVGNADGVFMIIIKKINGQWKIIADTSC